MFCFIIFNIKKIINLGFKNLSLIYNYLENKLIIAILVFVVMDIALLAVYVQKEPGDSGGVA